MITGELKNKIDSMWDVFAAGGVVNPLDVIEQTTYLMFIHDLDDTDNKRAKESQMLGLPFETIFKDEVRYKTTYQNNEKVYWNNDQNPNMYYGIRANSEGDGKRDIREVPSEEIRNAIGLVLHEQIGLNQADLVREAAKLLNYTRMGTNVITVLEESIADTKSKGFIELGSNDCWTLTDTGKWWAKEIVKAIGRD